MNFLLRLAVGPTRKRANYKGNVVSVSEHWHKCNARALFTCI